jgi:hypothetical protein
MAISVVQQLKDAPMLRLPRQAATRFRAVCKQYRPRTMQEHQFIEGARWNNRMLVVLEKIIANTGVQVRGGPFAGMIYPPIARPGYRAGGIASSLLGLYELEIHDSISRILASRYEKIVNVGCSEGFYAVGFARAFPDARVYAFDSDVVAQQLCKAAAHANGVAERVIVGGECTAEVLRDLATPPCLIMSDCDGYELELLRPSVAPVIAFCDILVELHDCLRPRLSEELLPRFKATHDIEIICSVPRNPDDFHEISFLTREERQIALDELRPPQHWAMMTSRQR